jgi:two-component system LytT family response regulator
MKRYSAIIVDDEPNVRETLELMLRKHCPGVDVRAQAGSAGQGRELLKLHEIDIIFLDIAMPKEDGFSFLNSIEKEKYAVIFITAYQEYALKALKANAIDYLLKPVNYQELKIAVSKAIYYFEIRNARPATQSIYQESLNSLKEHILSGDKVTEKITILEQYGFRILKLCELMYLQADSNYTILHLSGLDKIVVTRSLSEFEEMINNPLFVRIHKSTIINLDFLKAYSSFQGNTAELSDGTKLTISRRKLTEFREAVDRIAKIIEHRYPRI